MVAETYEPLGFYPIEGNHQIENLGLVPLNRQRLFGPLSSVTLNLVGDVVRTNQHKNYKFIILKSYYPLDA
jgi:hypothetical protein